MERWRGVRCVKGTRFGITAGDADVGLMDLIQFN
jgi:hypothetical protein